MLNIPKGEQRYSHTELDLQKKIEYEKGYVDGRASIDIKSIDRIVKVNIYLLRRYREDLLKEFGLNEDNALNLCDHIAEIMNKEMPNLWYEYGFVKGENK